MPLSPAGMVLREGQVLGPYRVVALAGSGGMGEVWRARDDRLQRDVALKVLHGSVGDAEGRRRLLAEARAVSALNHPHIIVVHDVLSVEDRDVLVMEFVTGDVLTRRIPAGGMKPREALKIAITIADAVATAHAAGVVHRDLGARLHHTTDPRRQELDGGADGLRAQTSSLSTRSEPMTRLMNAALILTCALLILSSTATRTRGQTRQSIRYPTMLDMTFPDFEAAVKKTDIVLLPIGAIEQHSSHLPLGTDAINATAQVVEIQQYLRTAGAETIVGPPLNVGITNEAGDWTRDGTYAYPGSLTISKSTFIALYVDLLRSLHDNGVRRAFLYIGHLGTRHVQAVVELVKEANRKIEGMTVYATVDSETMDRMKLARSTHILRVERLRNFEMVANLLGRGTEMPTTSHADGAETSWTLHFYPEAVRPGFERFMVSPSSIFREVLRSGDRSKNPSGTGGFPFDKASAAVGKQIVEYRTTRVGDTILGVLKRTADSPAR